MHRASMCVCCHLMSISAEGVSHQLSVFVYGVCVRVCMVCVCVCVCVWCVCVCLCVCVCVCVLLTQRQRSRSLSDFPKVVKTQDAGVPLARDSGNAGVVCSAGPWSVFSRTVECVQSVCGVCSECVCVYVCE